MGSRRKPFVFRVKRKDSTLTLTPECEVVEVDEDEKALSNYHHQADRNLYTIRWDAQNPQQVSAVLNVQAEDETWAISKLHENEYSLLERLITAFYREFKTLIISIRGHPFRIEVSHDSKDDLDYFEKQYESGEVEKTLIHHLVTTWTVPDVPCYQQTCDRDVASQENKNHGLMSEIKKAIEALNNQDIKEQVKVTQNKGATDRFDYYDPCYPKVTGYYYKSNRVIEEFREFRHSFAYPQDKLPCVYEMELGRLKQMLHHQVTQTYEEILCDERESLDQPENPNNEQYVISVANLDQSTLSSGQQLSFLQSRSDVDVTSDQETPSGTPPAEQTALEHQSYLHEQIEPKIHHDEMSDISVSPDSAVYVETSQDIGESTADLQEQQLNQLIKRGKADTERAIAETEGATTETEGATTESEGATIERERANTERERATTERERATTETLRVFTEKMRAFSKIMRAKQETLRAITEREEATTERERASIEAAAAIDEVMNVISETMLTSTETTRATAERMRAGKESFTAITEADRAITEAGKAIADVSRVYEETIKVKDGIRIIEK